MKGKQNNRYPFTACNVVPLIVLTIAKTPMASNKVLHQILEPYGKPYCCFMDVILQKARVTARRLIFCNPEENVSCAHFLKEDLEKSGCIMSLCLLLLADKPCRILTKTLSEMKYCGERKQMLRVLR